MKDSTYTVSDSIVSLNIELEALNRELDLIKTVNKELMIHQNYFSDIIDTQMDWFAMIFLITFGVLGLVYWLGIFRYFNKKFSEIEVNVINTRNLLFDRISQKDKESKVKIETNYTILDKKVDTIEELITKVFQEKIESIKKDVERIDESNSNAISSTSSEIKEIIEDQGKEFEKNKKALLLEIWQTNFDTRRAMFFSCYKDKSFIAALSWLIPMLSMIAERKVDEELDAFTHLAIVCAESAEVDEIFEEKIEYFNKILETAENEIRGDAEKAKLREVKTKLNKTYYSKAKDDPF